MHATPHSVTDGVARRLACQLRHITRALVCAPRTYLPRRIVDRAAAHLNAPMVHRLQLPGGTLPDVVGVGDVVVLHVEGADGDGVAEMRRLLVDPGLLDARIVVTAEREHCDWAELLSFDAVFGHRDLVLTESEILEVHPEAVDPAVLHSIIHLSGGVPALVAVAHGDARRYAVAVEEAAGEWAEDLLPRIVSDRLLRLQATLGRAGEDTVAAIATRLLERPVGVQEVRELRESSTAVTVVGGHYASFPDGLAAALRKLGYELDAHGADRWLADVLHAVDAVALDLTGLERIRVFATLGDWERVDQTMSTSMHLLVHASTMHQMCVRGSWPRHFPPSLKYLSRGRRYLDGLERPPRVGSATPETWLDLGYLLSSQEAPEPGSMVARVREWFEPLASGGRSVNLVEARRQLLWVARWLLTETASGVSTDRRRDDDSALLAGLLVGATDAGLLLGEMGVARECSAAAVRISADMGPRMDHYSGLRRGVILRAALMASHGGLPRVARAHLAEAERCRVAPEPTQDDLAALAESYARLDSGQAGMADAVALIDPDREWAPHESTVRALAIALDRGAEAGAQWASSMLQRASWASRPVWEWWPLHGVLVMLLLRVGMVADAKSTLERAKVPSSLEAVLQAAVDCAAGHTGAAAAQLDHALRSDQLSNRWRIVATGVKIACLVDDPARADDVLALVHSQDWTSALGTLAVLPDSALRILAPVLEEKASAHTGLSASQGSRPGSDGTVLTPRQRDILQALAEGGTMKDVARRLLVSTETVRSTAKAAYKRLGAGDRDSAVAIARARGLI